MRHAPVVVGVDETVAARAAVVWAAAEAAIAGTELIVLHAPQPSAAAYRSAVAEIELRAADDIGAVLLESAAQLARACEPGLAVRTVLSHGDASQALVDISAGARLVVLGSPGEPMGELSLLGSKRMRVCVHAHAPVLLTGQQASFVYPRRVDRVVVGAATSPAGRAAVEVAAELASARGVRLDLVQVSQAEETSAQERNRLALADDLAHRYPSLKVDSRSVVGDPTHVLPRASDEHSLVVVGCRHSDDRWSTRLGPVATAVMHRGRGPVILVSEQLHPGGFGG